MTLCEENTPARKEASLEETVVRTSPEPLAARRVIMGMRMISRAETVMSGLTLSVSIWPLMR